MKNEIQNLKSVLNLFDCEYEVFNESGLIYKSDLFDKIKENFNNSEAIKYADKYYEYTNKQIVLDDVKYNINLFKDITKYQKSIMMLKEDALTTLPNRYAIEMFLNNNVGNDIIAVICDLDDFKNINDTYGHPQGDIVLREFGIILKRLLSQDVFVGRYGGEEFVLFFKNKNIRYVKDQLSIIRKHMEMNPDLWNDKYNIKMSSGISIMSKENDLKLAIKEADMALYYVKNNGKNADALYDRVTTNCYIIE